VFWVSPSHIEGDRTKAAARLTELALADLKAQIVTLLRENLRAVSPDGAARPLR
jgi:hypothetical protein